jgi:hypothetical protein
MWLQVTSVPLVSIARALALDLPFPPELFNRRCEDQNGLKMKHFSLMTSVINVAM